MIFSQGAQRATLGWFRVAVGIPDGVVSNFVEDRNSIGRNLVELEWLYDFVGQFFVGSNEP